jgi:hypothetical protein
MDLIDKRIQELEEELNNSLVGSPEAKQIIDELDRLHSIELKDENAKKRHRIQVLNTILEGFKFIGGVAGTMAAIVLIAAIEEKTILGQKLLNLGLRILPRLL